MKIRLPRSAGFSLLEVTIAIVVTGVALVGIYAMIPVSLSNIGRSSNDTRIAQFVDEVVGTLEGKALQMRHQRKRWNIDFRQGATFLEALPSSSVVLESSSTMPGAVGSDATIRINGQINDLEWADASTSSDKLYSHKLWYRIKLLEPPVVGARMRHSAVRNGKSKWVKIEVWTRPIKTNTAIAPDAVVYSEILNPVF
jgi:prepilin-type N-terminal cleavage/methylation domain-containing protein